MEFDAHRRKDAVSDVDTARRALLSLDLTELGDGCSAAAVTTLLGRARTPFGPVAAVCIWPQFVSQARETLQPSGIAIATVVNFPAVARTTSVPSRMRRGPAATAPTRSTS